MLNSSGVSGLRAFSFMALILVSGRGGGWLAHRLLDSAAMTGDDDSRMLSQSSMVSIGGFLSSEVFPSRLVLRSNPVMLPLSGSLPRDSAVGVVAGTGWGS